MTALVPRFDVSFYGRIPNSSERPDLYDGVVIRRLMAWLVDVAYVALLTGLVYLALLAGGLLTFGLFWLLIPVVMVLAPFVFHTLPLAGRSQATLGMRMFGVYVESWTGGRPTLLQVTLRTAIFYASIGFTGWLVLIVIFFNDHRRGIHAYLSGTIVLRNVH
ncbi:MAG: RDD family protein [Alphaproteobacteria bacterium]|nr:RDD family protein [Alphaproteobacteria bacterium]